MSSIATSNAASFESPRPETELEQTATDLYHLASMLLGEGEETVRLIEHAVAEMTAGSSQNLRHASQLALAPRALAILERRDPASLIAPPEGSGSIGCIEDDDLESAAGVTHAELERMLTGSDNHHLRSWLESLPAALRVVFVLRAVATLTSTEVANLLAQAANPHNRPQPTQWTPEIVRSTFREGLCSLASQLLHSTAR